tara:strand:- start:5715 stop:6689 length:975 start_codon:yes stop_codon:yes gene_type:complete
MGLFKKIKKAFKKVVGGVKKAVKGVFKGVKKVVKKISSSKLLKALVIAGALIVTGGAAIGAFGGKLATTKIGGWMVGASQKVLTGNLFGAVKTGQPVLNLLRQTGNLTSKLIAKPFGFIGKAAGSTLGAVTDTLRITDTATRMGYKNIGTAANPNFVIDPNRKFTTGYFKGTTLATQKADIYGTIGVGKIVNPAGQVVPGSMSAAGVPTPTTTGTSTSTANVPSGPTTGQIMKESAISTGFGLAAGAVTNKYMSDDPRGKADSLFLESGNPLAPIQIYAAQNNIDFGNIYGTPTYGTGDPYFAMGASTLYNQDTIGMPPAGGIV